MISSEYYVIWNTETTQYYDHEERGDYYFTDRVNWAWKTTTYARAEKMCKKLNYYNDRCKVIKVSMQEVKEPAKEEPLTSGYLQEINPDGTSKYPVSEHIETTAYCSGCEEKDKIIADLENKIDKLLELFEGITEKIVDVCEECKEVGDYGN